MRTRHILPSVLFATALLAGACSDDSRLPSDQPETNTAAPAAISFTAALPPQTRTSYDRYDEGENKKGFVVSWKGTDTYSTDPGNANAADRIAIFVTEAGEKAAIGANAPLIYNPAKSGPSSSLSPAGEGITGLQNGTQYDFYAYYPDNGKKYSTVQVEIMDCKSQEQSAPDNSDHLGAYDFMYAQAKGITYSGENVTGIDFDFKHLLAFVQINVRNDLTSGGNLTVRKLHLSMADGSEKIEIPQTINLQPGDYSTHRLARQTLTVKSPAAAPSGEAKSYWMAVTPIYNTRILRVTVEADEGEYTYDLEAPYGGFFRGRNYVLHLAVTDQPTSGQSETWTPFISTAAQLAAFRDEVNSGNSYEGKTIALSADINLNGEAWTPIGTFTNPFKGTFDGHGYTISNLSVTTDSEFAGLFGYIDGAKILNLHAEGTITHNHTTNSGGFAGGICGYAGSSEISGCSFAGTVTGHGIAGGIAGTTTDTPVTACRNTATVSSMGMSGYSLYFGGIVGQASGKVTACYNTGKVEYTVDYSNKQYIGGICGVASSEVTACYNTGTVTAREGTDYIGSICGSSKKNKVAACYAEKRYTYASNTFDDSGDNPDCVTAFSATAWPFSAANAAWIAAANADGSKNHYWKSLGSWSGTLDASILPKLWWETK